MRQPQLDPRIAAFLAPKIRPPRIIGMQSLDLTPAELGQPPVAAPAAPAPAAAPSMRGQPRPGTPSPYDGDLLQGTDAEPRAPGRRFNTADVLAGIAAAASQLNGNPGAIDAWRSSREARSAKEAERARRARIQSMADELGLEGRERLAFEIDPEKWITEFGAPEEEKIAFIDLPDGRRVAVFDRILRGVMSGQLPYSALTGTSVGPQGAAPGVQQELPDVLPELPAGARVTPPRPTEAPATVGAAPQGFSNRDELLGFVRQAIPDARPTSGYRTQAEQDALRRRGVTSAERSSHTYGMGQDIVPPGDPSTWGPYVDQLRRSGRFRKVIIETGRGRNQGTAPHIHLEPY